MSHCILPTLVVLLLIGCGRPSLTESTLRVSVIREGAAVENVWVGLTDERYPCGRVDATVTLNGVPMRMQTDGTASRGSYLFIPTPGCLPPSFELEPGTDPRIVGQPFELIIDAGGERVVFHADALLTAGFRGPAEVSAGSTVRLAPNGEFSWAGVTNSLDVNNPGLARDPADSTDLAAQKWKWGMWTMSRESEALVATVPPNLPPGEYGWRVGGLAVRVPAQQCEGVASCNVSLSLDEVGKVAVRSE